MEKIKKLASELAGAIAVEFVPTPEDEPIEEVEAIVSESVKVAVKALENATRANVAVRHRGELQVPITCVTRVSEDGRMAEVIRLDSYEVVERRELRAEERRMELMQ